MAIHQKILTIFSGLLLLVSFCDGKKNGRDKVVAYDLSRAVREELDAQIRREIRLDAKKDKPSSGPFYYKIPKWPYKSLPFLKKDIVFAGLKADWATQAYSSSGSTKDISQLVFRDCIRVKDVLLASKLIDLGLAVPTADYEFLRTLKNQSIKFDASADRQQIDFGYIRHFLKDQVALGVSVPIVRRKNKIKLTSITTTQQNETLKSSQFFTYYPDGLIDFFKDILSRKQISFNEKDTEIGLGDVELFFNWEIPSNMFEHALVGLSAKFPTSKQRDVYKLWDPELGNGGFTEASVFGSLFYTKNKWFNPHAFLEFKCSVPQNVMRRVPRLRRSEDVTSSTSRYGDDFTPFGNNIYYTTDDVPEFCELDADVRNFPDTSRKIKIRPGGELNFRIGNMFEFFSEQVFFDLYYDLRAKGRNYTGFRYPDDVYKTSILTQNSFEVAQTIAGNFSYQVNSAWRMQVGASYIFAGRNVLKDFEINGMISIEF